MFGGPRWLECADDDGYEFMIGYKENVYGLSILEEKNSLWWPLVGVHVLPCSLCIVPRCPHLSLTSGVGTPVGTYKGAFFGICRR